MEVTITKNNFEAEVLRSEIPVLVDFWATWCAPCRMQGKILDEGLEALAATGANVAKVNVDEQATLAMRFNVLSIPTILIFKDGQKVQEFVGVQQISTLVNALK